jgi:TolB-like protein
MPRRDGDQLARQRHDDNIAGIPTSDATTSLEPTIISLAIVPFAFASVDSDAEYLSDRVTESLTSILSGLPQLRIMSRNIVFAVQEQKTPNANHVKPDT